MLSAYARHCYVEGEVEQQALKVYCTGLGGGDPPDNTYDVVLACVPRSPTYGATLARQDDWGARRTTIGRTAAVHEFFYDVLRLRPSVMGASAGCSEGGS